MFDRQVMLITGTSRGLGKHLVEYYVQNGFQVIGCSRSASNGSMENYRHFSLDVADEDKVKEMFLEIDKVYGRLDVLINNAALHVANYALLTPFKIFETVFKINVGSVFLFSCEAAKLMKRNSYGRIINFSSVAVLLGSEGTSLYGASKAAVEQFTRVFAREVNPYGVTVNALSLSFVEGTGMMSNLNEKVVTNIVQQTILKRKLRPYEVCDIVDLLISKKSQPVTGQTIYVDRI